MDYMRKMQRELEHAESAWWEVSIRVDVGRRASFHELGEVMRGLEEVFTVTERLGAVNARAHAAMVVDSHSPEEQWQMLRHADLLTANVRDVEGPQVGIAPSERSFLIESLAGQKWPSGELRPRVTSLCYRNPFDVTAIIQAILSDPFVALAETIRDWGPKRKEAKARADKAAAEAQIAQSDADLHEALNDSIIEHIKSHGYHSVVVPALAEARGVLESEPLDTLRPLLVRPFYFDVRELPGPEHSDENER